MSFKIDSLNTITAYLKKMRDETKKTGKNKTKQWACVHDTQDDFINRRINRKMIAINKQKEQRYSEKNNMIKFHEINGFNSGTSRAAVTDNYVMIVAIAHALEKTLRE